MGIWPWQCTPTGLDNSTELRMRKIHQAVTEIWVPQVWQPPARPPARTVTTIPLQPGGLRGKKSNKRKEGQLKHMKLTFWRASYSVGKKHHTNWIFQTAWPKYLTTYFTNSNRIYISFSPTLKLWVVYLEYLGEYWPCYDCTTLNLTMVLPCCISMLKIDICDK